MGSRRLQDKRSAPLAQQLGAVVEAQHGEFRPLGLQGPRQQATARPQISCGPLRQGQVAAEVAQAPGHGPLQVRQLLVAAGAAGEAPAHLQWERFRWLWGAAAGLCEQINHGR
ncbi:hypothetical protein [Cyanobium sp. ATX-6F1]|uniref:hypothetical protein n=1 Tax=Cyanobium sp. ATX-6F1 TaxID=3137388 RepID=UPI0039BDC68D